MRNYYMVRIRTDVDDFVKKSRVAVGWRDFDFSKYINNQDKLLKEVKRLYYSDNCVAPQLAGKKLGEVRRFINIHKGDVIVVPSYKSFYIGYATGEFYYDKADFDKELPNQLSVDFKKGKNNAPMLFARAGKNTALISKLGTPGSTVLDIKGEELTDEIDELLNSDKDISDAEKVFESEKKEFEKFKSDLKEVLSDYTKTSLESGGTGFEKLIKALMESDGYEADLIPKNAGGKGIADADIFAVKKSELSEEFTTACCIQAKHYWGESENGIDQIIAFKEQIDENNNDFINNLPISLMPENIKYFLISSGSFSPEVRNKAEQNNIFLIDGDQLSEILFNNIDRLDDKFRYQLGFVKKYEHYTGK